MYNIISGDIQYNVLYLVSGTQSVTYNGTIYSEGQTFRGIAGIDTYMPEIGAAVVEVLELAGGAIEYALNQLDRPRFSEKLIFRGMAIEFGINKIDDRDYGETTTLTGSAIELDTVAFSFAITETRL
ncbi:hypothetical protein HDF18_08490 [Mucilaginibacter sp. X5P1]|uniref:hypothetical protein n=1 Tax=Mucilaginibacter sp. X5P1 TaxID=2723088 RepID=UPI00161985BA|nr:hypothetical protein [Mucilaginibacter sp. X5P1]MBB6137695.1 hypothetical protein [Mucilaginibacter sp. X5P1]